MPRVTREPKRTSVAPNKQDLAQLGEAAVWRHIDTLDLWDNNPRYNDATAEEVVELFILYGFGTAMMAWPDPKTTRDRIIAGNTRKKAVLILRRRYTAALENGAEDLDLWHPQAVLVARTGMVPVRIRDDLTEEQATELALADNKSAEMSTWNNGLLVGLLKNMTSGRAMQLGWSEKELTRLLRPTHVIEDVDPQIERADELQKVWKVKLGQVWRCGEHLVMCGDSSNKTHIATLFRGERVTLVFTDPPYGVGIGKKNKMLQMVQKSGRSLADIDGDDLTPEQLKKKLQPVFEIARELVMADDCTLFVTAPQGGELGLMMLVMLQDAGFPVRHVLIWKKNKPTFSMGRLDYDYQHEPILLTWGKRHKRPMLGPYKTSVWEIDSPRASPEHPTIKPIELYENAMLNNSDEGDLVADFYGGSGTMLIAAERTHRSARVMELKPRYVSVALQRWLDATKVQPVLIQ